MEETIVREPLRREVRRILLDRLRSGDLRPGSRINESRLSEQIGVSRTPVREALIRLEIEGFVKSDKGRGFFVLPLDARTARELYTLAGLLEALALQKIPSYKEQKLLRLEELEKIRSRARREQDTDAAVEADNCWHAELVAACANRELLNLLEMLKNRLYRYEYLWLEQRESMGKDHDYHSRILHALKSGDRDSAIELLKNHWSEAAEMRFQWLSVGGEPDQRKWTSLM